MLLVLFFPETQRKLVGNGSKRVYGLQYQNLFWKITRQQYVLEKRIPPEKGVKRNIDTPNPLACVPMLFDKGSFCTMFLGESHMPSRWSFRRLLDPSVLAYTTWTIWRQVSFTFPLESPGAWGLNAPGNY